MPNNRLIMVLVLTVHTFLLCAQQEDKKPPRNVLSFHPIVAYGAGFSPAAGDIFILLHLGGEFRYGIDLFNNRYRVGPSVKAFWDDGDGMISNWSYLVGGYQQYNFLPKKHNRLYLETGIYYSNLCFCELSTATVDATPTPNQWYLSVGGGWDIFLHPHWSFKLGLQYHFLLNNPNAIQGYWGQNVIGIDYYFEPRPRRPNVVQKRAERRAARMNRG